MEEKQAPEVYKVIGAPGTGKTTRVVGNPELELEGLFLENMPEYSLKDQMLVTYTNAGVDEAADRLFEMLDSPRYKIDERVTTIHSQCYSILNDHPLFDGLDREQVVQSWDIQQFCKAYDLHYSWDSDDQDDIMAADKAEGNALMDLYGWLQSNRKDVSEWEDCPQPWEGQKDPEWLMNQWEEWKEKKNLVGFGDMIENVVELAYTQLENLGWGVLFPDKETTTKEMFLEARDDPGRKPEVIRGKGAFIDTKVLYVDEVQDLTPLQWEWYLAQKLVCEKVYIGGDDDQCLPPGETVEVGKPVETDGSGSDGLSGLDKIVNESRGYTIPDQYEPIETPIEDVEVGDMVKTSLTKGEVGYREVTDVHENNVVNKRFRTFTTESGKELTVTDNHKMFCRVPPRQEEEGSPWYYVYIMRDINDRWRVGRSQTLRKRLNIERTGRCIVPLGAYETKEEAAKQELLYSLNYGIPPITFTQRQGELLSSEENKEDIWDEAPHNIEQLAAGVGVDLEHPPLYKKAITRGRTESVNITIEKCSDSRGASMGHKLSIHTSNEEVISELKDVESLNANKRSRGGWRFRKISNNYKLLGDLAKEIKEKTGGDIITQFQPTDSRDKAIVAPACNIAEGMLIPVEKNGIIEWETISSVEDEVRDETVFDLTVDDTHNYLVSSSPISNTIYGWAGANPGFMLGEEGDFEVLEQTYRIPENIWNVCDGVIKQVEERQEKDVKPADGGGDVFTPQRPSPRQLKEHLLDDEVMVLFRTRYHIDEFRDHLHEMGIPYRNMSTFDTWSDGIVNLRDALAQIKKGEGKISGDQLDALKEYAEDDMIKYDNGHTKTESVLGNLGGISVDRVKEIVTDGYGGLSPERYLTSTDEVNYYEKEAILGNLKNGHDDLYPDRIRIGTIHSSKGKEAETVILGLDTTPTILENMAEDTMDVPGKHISDAERRVYYVGMTRASNNLVLAEGLIDPNQTIPLEMLLEDYDPKYSNEQYTLGESRKW